MFVFFLYFIREVRTEEAPEGDWCNEDTCNGWCKRIYNETTNEFLTVECWSETDQLFCRTLGYGLIICIAACIIPTIVMLLMGLICFKVFPGWLNILFCFAANILFGVSVLGFVCVKFEGYYFAFLLAMVPWFFVLIFSRFPDLFSSDSNTLEQERYRYHKFFMLSTKDSYYLEDPSNECPTYSPRRQYGMDQIPLESFQDYLTENLSVPPEPTITGISYYCYQSGKNCGWKIYETKTINFTYGSWEPIIVEGFKTNPLPSNFLLHANIIYEFDDDIRETINSKREEAKTLLDHSDRSNCYNAVTDIVASAQPNVLFASSKAVKVIHSLPMRILWEILNIFGYQMIIDIIWKYYVGNNNFHIFVKKHIYQGTQGRSKANERDQLIIEDFENYQDKYTGDSKTDTIKGTLAV